MKKEIETREMKSLRPGAVKMEVISNRRELEDTEVKELERTVFRNMDRIDTLKGEIESFAAERKAEIKQLEIEKSESRSMLKQKYQDEEVECQLIPDFEAGVMNYLRDGSDECVWTRPLKPSERQFAISNAPAKTGTE